MEDIAASFHWRYTKPVIGIICLLDLEYFYTSIQSLVAYISGLSTCSTYAGYGHLKPSESLGYMGCDSHCIVRVAGLAPGPPPSWNKIATRNQS